MANIFRGDDLPMVPMATFVGAGISVMAPANLPLWSNFRDYVIDCLGDADSVGQSALPSRHELVQQLKPESLMEVIRDGTDDTLIQELMLAFRGNLPNSNHHDIAQLCKDRFIRCVISTNFDPLLEDALLQLGLICQDITEIDVANPMTLNSFVVVASDSEWESNEIQELIHMEDGPIVVLKIHGTIGVDENRTRGIIATLKRAAKPLPKSKQLVLESVLAGFDLVVAGYSCNDDDIYPFLLRKARYTNRVYWNLKPDSPMDHHSRPSAILEKLGELGRFIECDLVCGEGSKNRLFGELTSAFGLPKEMTPKVTQEKDLDSERWKQTVDEWFSVRSDVQRNEVLGGLWEHLGNFSKSRDAYESALNILADGEGTIADFARLHLKIGRVAIGPLPDESDGESHFVLADRNLRMAIEEASSCGETTIQAEAMYLSGFLRSHWILEGKPDEDFRGSMKIAERVDDFGLISKIFFYQAFSGTFPFVRPRDHHEKLREAIRFAETSGEVVIKARCLRSIAESLLAWHDLDPDQPAVIRVNPPCPPEDVAKKARALLSESIEIFSDIGDIRGIASSRDVMSRLDSLKPSEVEGSKEFYVARDLFSKIGVPKDPTLDGIAAAREAVERKDFDVALKHYLQAASSNKLESPPNWEFGGSLGPAITLTAVGLGLVQLGCEYANVLFYDDAYSTLVKSREIFERLKSSAEPEDVEQLKIDDRMSQVQALLADIPPLRHGAIQLHRKLTQEQYSNLKALGSWCQVEEDRSALVIKFRGNGLNRYDVVRGLLLEFGIGSSMKVF